jgi:hypothetical protein
MVNSIEPGVIIDTSKKANWKPLGIGMETGANT